MTYFSFNGDGRITSSSGPIASYNNGFPFDASGNLVTVDGTSAPTYVRGSLPFESTGELAVDSTAAAATNVHSNGMPFTAAGRLSVDAVNSVAFTVNGLPRAENGVSIA